MYSLFLPHYPLFHIVFLPVGDAGIKVERVVSTPFVLMRKRNSASKSFPSFCQLLRKVIRWGWVFRVFL